MKPPIRFDSSDAPVRFNNFAKPIERRGDLQYFRWKVFTDEPDAILDKIESVEYLLHPTFPNPYATRKDRATKFSLESRGWGSFDIDITVNFKDGHKEVGKYYLDLKRGWPQGE